MSGFFPCMMFGIPGAALAMIHCAEPSKRKKAIGILSSAAVCSFVCGITEPFEFAFMFSAPLLYVAYSLLYGVFSYVTALTGFRAGFSFSAGATDLLFSASLPAAAKTWMILPLGLAAFLIFYLVFRFLISTLHLHTPGRESEDQTEIPNNADVSLQETIRNGINIDSVIQGIGGLNNIRTLDNCATRLRIELNDDSLVDEILLKNAGTKGVMKTGKNSIQVIIGLHVQDVADEIHKRLLAMKETEK